MNDNKKISPDDNHKINAYLSNDSQMYVCIKCELDHHTAKYIRDEIDGFIEKYQPKLLNLDFSEVSFMDTSGIGLIMGRYKAMISINGNLKVINIPQRLERIIKFSGLASLGIF